MSQNEIKERSGGFRQIGQRLLRIRGRNAHRTHVKLSVLFTATYTFSFRLPQNLAVHL